MVADKRTNSHLEVTRKALHRRSPQELADGTLLSSALDLCLTPPPDASDLERLSFAIEIFRQATLALSPTPPQAVVELVNTRLAPVLRPRGQLAALIQAGLANPVKPHPLRSAEALTAASRLAAALPAYLPTPSITVAPPSASASAFASTSTAPQDAYILEPLWNELLGDALSARPVLVALNVLSETVPLRLIPSTLLPRLLEDVSVGAGANIRCSAIATLLSRRREDYALSHACASEVDKDAAMFEPIVSVLEDEEATQAVSRYLLPPLFKAHRASFPNLLALLDSHKCSDLFAAWVATAAFGVSEGIVNLDGLDRGRLYEAIVHEDDRIRIQAFELVALSKSVLREDVLGMVKESLVWNTAIPHAEGRTNMASAVYAFLQHLKSMTLAANRDLKRPKTTKELAVTLQNEIGHAAEFHSWFINVYLTPSIAAARATPALRAIFALKMLKLYLDVFGSDEHLAATVYSPERVQLLIACQASEFAETRNQARDIIAQGPTPLPGYASLDSPNTLTLLTSARASINNPRRTQADAGRAALVIVFTKIVQPAGAEQAVAFVSRLVDVLENHLSKVEADLGSGIVEFPLHGPLSAITAVIHSTALSTPEAQAAWRPLLHRLFTIVNRVWAATRKVVSLGPSKDDDGSVAHEIARAYEVLGDGDDDGGEEDMDHTNLLSGCWRAMREASDLLSAIITTPLAVAKEQTVWTKDEINDAGMAFLTWLHEIRHRGTFAKIAPALAHVVGAVKKRPDLAPLVDQWLESELETVALGELSTLRRSAALPFTFLSLVSSDERLLDRTIDKLVELARLGPGSLDTTKVHAMNTLKIVLLDAKQTRFLPKYFERVITVALAAFGSSNWNVRNVGLLLFSTTALRSLATARAQEGAGTRAALAGRQTLASWSGRYPSIIPYVTKYLREFNYRSRASTATPANTASLTEHSPLFPILIILRSLRWSPEDANEAATLYQPVEYLLSSPEWFVRAAAAQALSSLTSPLQSLERAKTTATRLCHPSQDANTAHGRALFLCRLLADVVPWTDNSAGASERAGIEARLRDMLSIWRSGHPAVLAALMDAVRAYIEQAGASVSPGMRTSVKAAALGCLSPRGYAPGVDLLQAAASKVLLLEPVKEPHLLHLLGKDLSEDAQLAALGYLETHTAFGPEVLGAVAALPTSEVSVFVQEGAYRVISAWPDLPQASEAISRAGLGDAVWWSVESTCVPLAEAARGALSRCDEEPSESQLAAYAAEVDRASDENASEPSRLSALQCIRHLGSVLFERGGVTSPARRSLHASLLRMLQDDDEDVRLGAAEVVRRGLRIDRPVLLPKAVGMWWAWLAATLKRAGERDVWAEWLWERVLNRKAIDEQIGRLAATSRGGEVLFVEEPPNLFRNPLDDARAAAVILAELGGRVAAEAEFEAKAGATEAELRALIGIEASPIDDAWDAQGVLGEWKGVLRTALGM